jgi:AcrR family transcriptional regulator
MSKGQHIRITGLAKAVGAASGRSENGIGRRERRAAETRVRLFRCALQLIAERGYTNVTVEDITEAADVGKGTFFNYFETKDHVLGVMAEIQLSKVREAASLAAIRQAKDSVRVAPARNAACRRAWTQSRPGPRHDLILSG